MGTNSKSLAAVTRATVRKDKQCQAAFDQYVQAMRDARAAGHTLEAIGQAAGITKQGVRYLLIGDHRKDNGDG